MTEGVSDLYHFSCTQMSKSFRVPLWHVAPTTERKEMQTNYSSRKPWISWRELWIHFSFLISKCASKDLSYYSKAISWHLDYTYGARSSPRNSILSADNGWDWASLVAQTVKNPPAMQETWVLSQGREDAQQDEMATHSSILAWRIPWTEAWRATVHGVTGVRHDRATHTHRLSITIQESSGIWNKNR